jgi:peptide/nickel transport system substrate-binding protein
MAFDAADLKTLDPHYASANVDRALVHLVFNGLIRFKPGSVRMDLIEPDLAQSWEVSKDGLSWIFHLRKGVMFQPWGSNPAYELTSEDVIFSLEKAADPKRSVYAGSFNGITFKAPDKYTVVITTSKPMSPFLFLAKVINYAGGFIVSKKAVESMGLEKFRLHPVGTGPFMFHEYKPKEKVVLVRNERYFRGVPALKKIEMLYMPDVSARNLALRTGELDLIEGPMEDSWIRMVKTFPNTKVDVFGPGSASVIYLNLNKEPFNKLKVRQAIAYAISRDELIAAIGKDVAEPIFSPVPVEYLPGGLTKEEVEKAGLLYSADRKKAKKLLVEAGYANGFQVEVIHTEMATMLRPMESIQAQLKKVGIDLKLRIVDHSTFHKMIRDDASPIVHYMAWRPNADVFLTRFYHSNSTVVSGSKPDTNFSHYKKIDSLIEQAKNTMDSQKQIKLWKEAQMHILKDLPAIPLFIKKFTLAHKDYVDYGFKLESNIGFYIPITEKTKILSH